MVDVPSGLQLAVTFCCRPTSISLFRVAAVRVLPAAATIGVVRVLTVNTAHANTNFPTTKNLPTFDSRLDSAKGQEGDPPNGGYAPDVSLFFTLLPDAESFSGSA